MGNALEKKEFDDETHVADVAQGYFKDKRRPREVMLYGVKQQMESIDDSASLQMLHKLNVKEREASVGENLLNRFYTGWGKLNEKVQEALE